jgi:hypothetical protein
LHSTRASKTRGAESSCMIISLAVEVNYFSSPTHTQTHEIFIAITAGNNGAFSSLALRICVPINCSGSLVRSRRVQIKHLRVLECSPADIFNTRPVQTRSHMSHLPLNFSARGPHPPALFVCALVYLFALGRKSIRARVCKCNMQNSYTVGQQ